MIVKSNLNKEKCCCLTPIMYRENSKYNVWCFIHKENELRRYVKINDNFYNNRATLLIKIRELKFYDKDLYRKTTGYRGFICINDKIKYYDCGY